MRRALAAAVVAVAAATALTAVPAGAAEPPRGPCNAGTMHAHETVPHNTEGNHQAHMSIPHCEV